MFVFVKQSHYNYLFTLNHTRVCVCIWRAGQPGRQISTTANTSRTNMFAN